MSAREVAAVAIHYSSENASAEEMADRVLSHLREDGYRIIAPGELDPDTLKSVYQNCREIVQSYGPTDQNTRDGICASFDLYEKAALRNLKGNGNG